MPDTPNPTLTAPPLDPGDTHRGPPPGGPDPPPDLLAPPGYVVEGELGRGGMGVVYQARQVNLNRPVALKVMAGGGRAAVARFWAEAEAVAAVRHPHVVQVFDFGEHAGRPFMAMECCPGGSLADRPKPLPPLEAAALVEKIARGVDAAHDAGIVHRDLKPGNVLFDAEGEPKVADFGLAKRTAVDLTNTQAVMGTPAYMAPELAEGRAKFVGPAADVWALGVILYELLTGRRPFDGESVNAILLKVTATDAPGVRTVSRRVPRDLDTVVAKCLAREPHLRYATAGDLADDLARFTCGEHVSARPPSLAERFGLFVRHPSRATDAGLGSLFLVMIATAWMLTGIAVYGWKSATTDGAVWPSDPSARPLDVDRLAVVHLNAVVLGLGLPLAYVGSHALRRRPWAYRAGLVLASAHAAAYLAVALGEPQVRYLFDPWGFYAESVVRVPMFTLLFVATLVLAGAYVLAIVSDRARRNPSG